MATTATATPGKTSFVKEFLHDNPQGNTKAVNEAWRAAGFEGTISPTLVNKTRVKLTGKRRRKARTAAQGKAAATKPREAPATLGKTSFVKEFLNDNPQGNVKAVNKAWTRAGMSGTISSTLVYKMRALLGLTGNLRGNSKTAAKEKSAPRMPREATATPGKTSFLKEFLHDHPEGNVKAVNEAWTAAGFDGTISGTLVYKARASLGLTGNLSGKTKTSAGGKATPTGKKLGRPRKKPTAPVTGQPRSRKSNRSLALNELEADIDRLIFKVMGVGDLTEIEDSLRQARRLLYVSANER